MNYIRHLNDFFVMVRSDKRLACSHVSLYLALFQHWNYNRFSNPFPVYRESLMDLSKIGSKNTYHKCIKDLHETKYIFYHPSASRFLPVKISMSRLDMEPEPVSKFRPLNLFESPHTSGEDLGGGPEGLGGASGQPPCPKIGTDGVPKLGLSCPKIDTGTVPKMGHYIKQTFKNNKTVCNTPTLKNQNLEEENPNGPRRVSKLGHRGKSATIPPELRNVEIFFAAQGSSAEEANRFFLYNQSKGWMITDKAAVRNWKALAEKWLLNPTKAAQEQKQAAQQAPEDLPAIFKRFLHGEKFFGKIAAEHFEELKLQLTDALIQDAWSERHHRLTGSNDYKTLKLMQAYEAGDRQHPLIQADWPNLVTLAKRIAVAKHFFQLKQSGATALPP